MARVPSKHGRDQALDFQGFLNDLQDWELSFKDKHKDKQMKPQASNKAGEDKRSAGNTSRIDSYIGSPAQHDYLKNFNAIDHLSSSFMNEESTVDATSEKESGNEYFKQKKFKEAIECYSRSIALSPTAVAYANRAMAYLKIKKFEEAEDDCTEALNLDDRYIKAYSRRATARKELGKFKDSIEDSEFALRLEPNNQEIKKQYAEVKSLYEKEILQKVSGVGSLEETQKEGGSEAKVNGLEVNSVSRNIQRTSVSTAQKGKNKESDGEALVKKSSSVEEIKDKSSRAGSKTDSQQPNDSHADATSSSHVNSIQGYNRTRQQELKASVQELASRAASHAMAEAAKNITPPKSAYQFEVSWQGFSGDRALQAHLLKITSPSALPQILKNALSAPMLIDIIKCVATFFIDDTNLAVKYLENLAKVPRFNMLIMCLSAADKADLVKIWDEVFCGEATSIEHSEILDDLRSKYCLKL